RRRYRIMMAAVMFGALATIVAVVIGAVAVVDRQALRADETWRTWREQRGSPIPAAVRALSAPAPAATVGSATASPRVGSPPAPPQAIAGDPGPSTEAISDPPETRTSTERHRRKHGRHYARWRSRHREAGRFGFIFGR